ncbi:hypothetical protein [Curvibacter delicatus]|uniref:hypothetical protein n=1 Tax=Curvibacter delicatus TaxID=80879 RepID=UPI00082FFA77|nr:hypothetical protein [Curvibacter delicatus]
MGYLNAMQGVELGMVGLQAGLNRLTMPQRPLLSYYRWQPEVPQGVSVDSYNALVVEHNALVDALVAERKRTAQLQSQLRDALRLLKQAVDS